MPTEDEDDQEEFQPPQPFNFEGFLECGDVEGTHALMVRLEIGGWEKQGTVGAVVGSVSPGV